jgi:hypothetical protein
MRTELKRLVAALVVTSVAVTGLSPVARAQQPMPPGESTPLEQWEQPMMPIEPPAPVPPADVAQAQQPAPVAPPPPPPAPPAAPPVKPTPPPPPPMQPELFQEQLKAQQRAEGRKRVLYGAGAVLTNIFLIPGRAITCTLGAGLGVAVLGVTLGTGYKAAAAAFDEGCGGKWIVSGDDLRPEGSRAFEWER